MPSDLFGNSAIRAILQANQTINADWNFADDEVLGFGSDNDFSLLYDSNNDRFSIKHLSTEKTWINVNEFVMKDINMRFLDGKTLVFGNGSDRSIQFDGTDWLFTGAMNVIGDLVVKRSTGNVDMGVMSTHPTYGDKSYIFQVVSNNKIESQIRMNDNNGGLITLYNTLANPIWDINNTSSRMLMYIDLNLGGNNITNVNLLDLSDNNKIRFGTGQDAIMFYDGSDLHIDPDANVTGSGDLILDSDSFILPNDNAKITFGAGLDRSIYFDGTDWIFGSGSFTFDFSGTGQNYRFGQRADLTWTIQAQVSGNPTYMEFYTKDGDGTDSIVLSIFGVGTPESITNAERFRIWYDSGSQIYRFGTQALGTGTLRNLSFQNNGGESFFGGIVRINGDNRKLFFGAGNDSSIYYDGVDLIIDSQEVGSGSIKLIVNDGSNSHTLLMDELLPAGSANKEKVALSNAVFEGSWSINAISDTWQYEITGAPSSNDRLYLTVPLPTNKAGLSLNIDTVYTRLAVNSGTFDVRLIGYSGGTATQISTAAITGTGVQTGTFSTKDVSAYDYVSIQIDPRNGINLSIRQPYIDYYYA